MTVFLLLFRGVGGATQLPVAPLRECLADGGFQNAATYINSGNALVKSDLPHEAVAAKVAELCAARFGFRKEIHVRTREEWAQVIADNPFSSFAAGKALHAALLAAEPEAAKVQAVRGFAQPGEGFAVVGRTAYLHTPNGFGTSKLAEKFDRGIGVPNTARNWNTVLKLMELVDRAAA